MGNLSGGGYFSELLPMGWYVLIEAGELGEAGELWHGKPDGLGFGLLPVEFNHWGRITTDPDDVTIYSYRGQKMLKSDSDGLGSETQGGDVVATRKTLIELIKPDAAAVKKRLFFDMTDETADDMALDLDTELLTAKHQQAIAIISEQTNRTFTGLDTDVAYIQAKELSYSLAGFLYENPVSTTFPDDIQKGIDRIKFVAGWW